MERQKSKHEKREKKTPGIKHPKTTTTTKKWINLDYVQKFNKKWKLEKCWVFFKLRGKTNLIFVGVGLK